MGPPILTITYGEILGSIKLAEFKATFTGFNGFSSQNTMDLQAHQIPKVSWKYESANHGKR